jgi:hypothetical protein
MSIWLKHKPEGSRTDGLKILIVSDFNIAGQPSLIFRNLNSHTNHCARMAILHPDYLAYDSDLIINPTDVAEIKELANTADIIHVGRTPSALSAADLDVNSFLKHNKLFIQYWGSEIRGKVRQIHGWHVQNDILGLSAWDETMLDYTGLFYYHIPMMVDLHKLPLCPPSNGVIKICHDSTNRKIKKTDLFIKVMEELKQKYVNIESNIIENVSNEHCLKLKSQHHIFYAEIGLGCYGMSAMEAMGMGMVVLSSMDNFAISVHANCPIVKVTEETLKDKLEHIIQNPYLIGEVGEKGLDWVRRHHNPELVIQQYSAWYDYVKNGRRLMP